MCGIVSIRPDYTVRGDEQQRLLHAVTLGDGAAISLQPGGCTMKLPDT
jgi:hypothetical protein